MAPPCVRREGIGSRSFGSARRVGQRPCRHRSARRTCCPLRCGLRRKRAQRRSTHIGAAQPRPARPRRSYVKHQHYVRLRELLETWSECGSGFYCCCCCVCSPPTPKVVPASHLRACIAPVGRHAARRAGGCARTQRVPSRRLVASGSLHSHILHNVVRRRLRRQHRWSGWANARHEHACVHCGDRQHLCC